MIFLDRRHARYFLLSPHLQDAFAELIAGEIDTDPSNRLLVQLIDAGIATSAPGAPFRAVLQEPALSSMLDKGLPPARPVDLVLLLVKEITAKRALARGHFDALIEKIEMLPSSAGSAVASDRGRLVSASDKARLFRSAHDQCLPRSYALARALRRRGDGARLILGVTGSPFFAHAWVQAGSEILNDELDRVRLFTPILAI